MLLLFYNANSVFLAVNARLCWFDNVKGVYLVQVFLILIGQLGLGHFHRCRPLLPIGWRIVQILRQRQKENDHYSAKPLLMQYKQQASTLLSRHNYTPLVISGNDKNKQLTLLNQHKLA